MGELLEARDDEDARLEALRRYDILDTPPDGSFDHIASIAASLFDVPIAIISLVDHDRIWFKAHHGLDVEQIGRDPGLCASAIMQAEPYLLTDASTDPRSLANPLVAGDFGLRFYLAAPLRTRGGHNLGTLCVIDRKPRTVSPAQIAQLQALAEIVIDQMELRLSARSAIASLEDVVEQKDVALGRSETLAKEIDHRVMNSLQQVSALLSLHAKEQGNPEAAHHLSLAAGRVAAVAQVHQHILRSGEETEVGSQGYLERLCGDLSNIVGEGSKVIVDAIDIGLPIEAIPPIGLAVNELVTNACKFGATVATVAFDREAGGRLCLSVTDNGGGLPPDFNPQSGPGLGMKVVRMVTRQLGGVLECGPSEDTGGTRFKICFPEPRPVDRG